MEPAVSLSQMASSGATVRHHIPLRLPADGLISRKTTLVAGSILPGMLGSVPGVVSPLFGDSGSQGSCTVVAWVP